MAAGAEVPAFAGGSRQILVRTDVAADAREPMAEDAVREDAAREDLVGDLRDNGRHEPYTRAKRSS